MATEYKVSIVIKATDQASKRIKSLGDAADKTTDELEEMQDASKGVDKGLKGGIDTILNMKSALMGMAAVGAAKAVWELGELGAQSLRTGRAFEAISGGADEATKNLEAMKRATRGAMSEQEMMAQSSRLMQMGLARNSDELEEMTTMAVRLGTAMGRDATQSVEEFALLLANQSIPRLDTFGISASKVRARIAELQAATEGLGREEAFLQAVREEGAISMARLGDATEDEMLAFEQLRASTDDLKAAYAERLAPAISGVARLLAEQATAVKEHTTGMDEYEQSLWAMGHAEEMATEQAQALMHAQMEAAGIFGTSIPLVDELTEAQAGLAIESGKVARAFGEMEFDTESMWKMALASGANVTALSELAIILGIADQAEIDAALQTDELTRAFGAGTISAEEYAEAMRQIGRAAEEAAQARSIYGGSTPGYQHGTGYHPGGGMIVGEGGPEFLVAPRGTQVQPNYAPQTQRILNDRRSYSTTINDRLTGAIWMEQQRQDQLGRANRLMG